MKNEEQKNNLKEGSVDSKNLVLEKLLKTKSIATHYGDDLDNKSSIYAIETYLKEQGTLSKDENLTVERIPAGQIKEGLVNVDTGGHKGNRFDNDTIVIDGDPANNVKSACEALKNLGFYVPEQIIELADARPTHISPLDSRTGLALVRYLSGEQAFKLAEAGLLDKTLTDKQLEEYGLTEAHLKQQKIIDTAVEKINKYTVNLDNGEKIVIAPEQITAGSMIAYEMGIPYYASTNKHLDKEGQPDGVTFAISCKTGMKLPKEVLEYGRQMVEQYKNENGTSGVFVHPNESLIVAGGPKNPDFKVDFSQEELMNTISNWFNDYAREDLINKTTQNLDNIDKKTNEIINNDIKIDKAKELSEEINKKDIEIKKK